MFLGIVVDDAGTFAHLIGEELPEYGQCRGFLVPFCCDTQRIRLVGLELVFRLKLLAPFDFKLELHVPGFDVLLQDLPRQLLGIFTKIQSLQICNDREVLKPQRRETRTHACTHARTHAHA